ncbi:MAG: glycoside hydrolase family 2 protein [Acidimicrobiia bacterium]
MELTDGWRAAVADDDLRRAYTAVDFDDAGWQPITVPGHWRSTPAFARSDGPLLHRCRFEAAPPGGGVRLWLTFDGLFYQGDVWLDGTYLGDTEGYFVPHTFEVTDVASERSEHVLAVEATCTPERRLTAKRNLTGVFQHWDALDPDWNPGGIWRPVRVAATGPVRIGRLRVLCREATESRAAVALRATLDSDIARTVRVRTELGGTDHEMTQPLAAGQNDVEWTVTVDRPALWWPRALGDAVLHDVRVTVLLPREEPPRADAGGAQTTGVADAGERISDEQRLRTGLRQVALRRWIWTVNGERLFAKGTNQGPSRMALAKATADELRRDVDLAVEAGLDLVRIHAHIAREETYEAADERGLLLWQDLPLQWGYARGVRRHAARQASAAVDLLGHHPSIALWCGHNEPIAIDDPEPTGSRGRRARIAARVAVGQQLPSWNKTVLDGSVRRALERSDGTRPVVAHSGVVPHAPRFDGTDSHLYLGWYGGAERALPGLLRVIPRLGRFVSEFGAQAVPSGDVAFMEPDRWPDLDWERLAHTHCLQRSRFDRYVPPADHETFDGWRDATQRYQATLIKHHIETLRRLKYRPAGGFAQFSFADAHPAVTWSVLDHERRPKLGHEALREACRPVIVVADRLPARVRPGQAIALDIHVVSDLRTPVDGARVTARLSWPGDEHRRGWRGDIPADDCVRVGTLQFVVPDAPGELALDLELRLPDGEPVCNRYTTEIAGG